MEIISLASTLAVFLCVHSSAEGLTCYDCGQSVITQQRRCNATSTCPQGQRCLLKSLVSSIDGHKQFEMRCGNVEECDGVEIVPVGKRAVHSRSLTLECCTTNLCNIPAFGPVVPSVSTCYRDIEVMLEDSTGVSVAEHGMLIQFLKSFVSHMNIGAQSNQNENVRVVNVICHGARFQEDTLSVASYPAVYYDLSVL
ncbi:uncharacterized protein LOC123560564 [Mercenaria mercenaria]|uniref:uncharacterized protein LOC123560564 n=1 Tax=Mercenaria mercenaria TaxID=6596 RepID=UPI00234E3786|nr:uncharacterized protein LOC123560564 [Mercenaria mercenaria]